MKKIRIGFFLMGILLLVGCDSENSPLSKQDQKRLKCYDSVRESIGKQDKYTLLKNNTTWKGARLGADFQSKGSEDESVDGLLLSAHRFPTNFTVEYMHISVNHYHWTTGTFPMSAYSENSAHYSSTYHLKAFAYYEEGSRYGDRLGGEDPRSVVDTTLTNKVVITEADSLNKRVKGHFELNLYRNSNPQNKLHIQSPFDLRVLYRSDFAVCDAL